MRITKKIMRWGNSLGIILDKNILKFCDLDFGDLIELEIKKVRKKKFERFEG